MKSNIAHKRTQKPVIGNTSIVAEKGDITDQEVEVIVNSANTWMSIGGRRSVSGAIIRRTNGKVLDDLAKVEKPVPLGNIVVTKGHNLLCRFIFHLATHGSASEERVISGDDMIVRLYAITEGISNIVKEAEKLEVSSLAMPIFATGSLGYSAKIVIESILNCLQENLRKGSRLKEVRIVVFRDDEVFNELERGIRSTFVNPLNIPNLRDYADLIKKGESNYKDAKLSLVKEPASSYGQKLFFVKKGAMIAKGQEETELDLNQISVPVESIRNLEAEIFNLREQVRILREENSKLTKDPTTSFQLPLPVAFAASMVEAETTSPLRVENLRRALSILLRYLAVIGMAEYAMAKAFSQELNESLIKMFQTPLTDGAWLKIATDVAKAFCGDQKLIVVEEYGPMMFGGKKSSHLHGLLQGLLKLRNEIHESCLVDDTSTRKWLEKAEPLWGKILQETKLLLQYQLVFVENLLDFGESDPAKHQYQIRWLMGEFFVPRAEIVEWKPRLKKGRLFLKHPEFEQFLPLYPFMIYEHCQITKAREASCIENVLEDSISFSTFRFPYKWQDTTFLGEIKKLFGKNSEAQA